MSEGSPLPESKIKRINQRLESAQKPLLKILAKKGLVEAYADGWKKLPKVYRNKVRTTANGYGPPRDDESGKMRSDSLALERGLVLGTVLGINISRNNNSGIFFGRALRALDLLNTVEDRAYDAVDVMSFSARGILESLSPGLILYHDPPEDPLQERRNDIYSTGLGYTASIGLNVLIEEELKSAQTQDPSATAEIEAGIEGLAVSGVLSTQDLDW